MTVTLVCGISWSALTAGFVSGMLEGLQGVFSLWTSTMETNPKPHPKQVNCDRFELRNASEVDLKQYVE